MAAFDSPNLEARREREVFRILPQLLDTNTNASSGHLPPPSEKLASAHDPVLTALAQLAVFKLDVRRCLVSVFDRKRQVVIAEATKDSVLCPSSEAPWDQAWLGGTAIPRGGGICEHVLLADGPSPPTHAAAGGHVDDSQLVTSVVPDLMLDPRFRDRPYMLQPPFNRLYAGVALVTGNGVRIGVLCVFDEKPRLAGLDEGQLRFMRDLSRAVTTHLESHQPVTTLRRGERMVRGLGSFFEGKTTISRWQRGSSAGLRAANPGLQNTAESNTKDARRLEEELHRERPQPVSLQPASTGNSPPTTTNSAVPTPASSRTIRTQSPLQDSMPHDTMAIFGRAANIIRESVEADGVVFLDASISTYGGLVAGGQEDGSQAHSPNVVSDVLPPGTTANEHGKPRTCQVLGFSTSTHSSIQRDCLTATDFVVTDSMLQQLLARHPSGRIFTLDDDGAPLETNDDGEFASDTGSYAGNSHDGRRRQCSARTHDYELVASMFPGARSVLLVPMWDSRTNKWFAGSFLWTTSSARCLTAEGELSYLRAFAATIMADVDRADAAASERAKSVLLGSLSHELRSPLHGIVAAVELLQDTELSTFQAGLLQTMDYCGRTLLDVIDHLLDYSKINTLVRSKQPHAGHDQLEVLRVPALAADGPAVEVDALVEETVESVFSGLHLQRSADVQRPRVRSGSVWSSDSAVTWASDTPLDHARPAALSVFLDCDPHANWLCQVDAGAVRRLLMNLVGNALKYTATGFVHVRVRQSHGRPREDREESANDDNDGDSTPLASHLLLDIADSGRGIDPDFLRNRAFRPFSQEDVLSQGTGLGLSLVKDIVEALRGSLHIESQLQHGTTVTVAIPIPPPATCQRALTPFWDHVRALRGLRVSLQGFRAQPTTLGVITSTTTATGYLPPTELDIMTTLCRDWLQLDIVSPDTSDIRPDLILCTDKAASSYMAAVGVSLPPVVAICESAASAHSYSLSFVQDSRVRILETMSQPIGPRKLASALVLAIGKFNKARSSELALPHSPPARSFRKRSLLDALLTPAFPNDSEFPFPAAAGGASAAAPPQSLLLLRPGVAMSSSSSPLLPQQLGGANTPTQQHYLDSQPPASSPSPPENYAPLAPQDVMGDQGNKNAQAAVHEAAGPLADPECKTSSSATPCDIPRAPSLDAADSIPTPIIKKDHFLLVDDNNVNLQILVSFMKKLGHPYQTATNGLEALEAYAEAAEAAATGSIPFSYVLMDISMPVMDGLESTRRIRQLEKSSEAAAVAAMMTTTTTLRMPAAAHGVLCKGGASHQTDADADDDSEYCRAAGEQQQQEYSPVVPLIRPAKIIALTGLASAAAQKEAFASGVDVYLTKPVRFRDLSRVLLEP
ncbi:hypothetical protein Micbo1qcDRAFT_178675 [Microdochium bolleyi]|uniref:histidine kinase n=1 Tax=Microdochium bolleyi TaxID=196109 RepID=A0A136ISV1_9PEZI|nr:hypothetical protein Micbo1qcDRAFT_178675 [Microdochium bolleyi]